jgi:hypothetical protein
VSTDSDHYFRDLFSADPHRRNPAVHWAIGATDNPVTWAYHIWDRAVLGLTDKDNHIRAVSAQLLCNLAKSDPEKRILRDFDALLDVTRDGRFVTARHCLQNIWKIGAAGDEQLTVLIDGLRLRYTQSATEKNSTLIRYDIIVGLANLYAVSPQPVVMQSATAWIEEEQNPKYRKKYAGAWKQLSDSDRR